MSYFIYIYFVERTVPFMTKTDIFDTRLSPDTVKERMVVCEVLSCKKFVEGKGEWGHYMYTRLD